MMSKLEKLKENYPELVAEYSAMTKDELLEQICAEVLDLHAMEERVQAFMNECTLDMSKTNYTISSIKSLINSKQEHDINQFCADILEDNETVNDILQDLKDRSAQI